MHAAVATSPTAGFPHESLNGESWGFFFSDKRIKHTHKTLSRRRYPHERGEPHGAEWTWEEAREELIPSEALVVVQLVRDESHDETFARGREKKIAICHLV